MAINPPLISSFSLINSKAAISSVRSVRRSLSTTRSITEAGTSQSLASLSLSSPTLSSRSGRRSTANRWSPPWPVRRPVPRQRPDSPHAVPGSRRSTTNHLASAAEERHTACSLRALGIAAPPPPTTASTAAQMSDGEELSDRQKREIAVWFLSNAPAGEIHYVAKDVRALLGDEAVYEAAAAEAFPEYNKAHLVSLELPDRSGDIIVTTYGELDKNNYLDPRTAQVATVDHIKQNCTKLRPAADEELPSAYIEDFRSALDVELSKYVGEAYPKGACAVYCTSGKDIEGPGADFGFAAVISAARRSPQNFCNGSWRSIWTVEFSDGLQFVEIKGKIQVGAHYFEEGNVQLDTNIDCKDSTILQSPEECAVSITNIIRHHESEYLSSLEESYLNLSDATFKDLRRKLPVTRTLFPWHNTLALSLTRDLTKELAIGK